MAPIVLKVVILKAGITKAIQVRPYCSIKMMRICQKSFGLSPDSLEGLSSGSSNRVPCACFSS